MGAAYAQLCKVLDNYCNDCTNQEVHDHKVNDINA